jgi:Tfp pilus assembly protein PilF
MDERMTGAFDDRVDPYMAGELSAAQQRELAQAALDDPALFDTLTAAALVKDAVRRDGAPPGATEPPRRRRRARLAMVAGIGLAAAAVIAWLLVGPLRPTNQTAAEPAQADAGTGIGPAAVSAAPVFLTARLGDSAAQFSTFRSVERGSRLPRESGVVVSVEDGAVEVDLGSLDGLANGASLRLSSRAGSAGATLELDAVFRERSRGHVTGGAPQVGDRAEVSRADYVAALLDHAQARAAAGDLTPARRLAELAVARADSAETPADVRRRALAALGSIEHRAGALDEAARHLRRAVEELQADAPAAERARVLDDLASVLIERRQYADAEPMLQAAQPHATGPVAVRVANNLGAIAAMRGDRAAAESRYRTALDLASASPELADDARAIRANLNALGVPAR